MHALDTTLLWYEQGFLRGSVTSTHRDGTYDVAFWPSSEAALGGSGKRGTGKAAGAAGARRYIPVLSTDSSTQGGKTAIEGHLEKGVPAHYVRGLQGTSVLTQPSSSRRGNKHNSTKFPLHLCLSEDQLRRSVRPWARHDATFVPQASEGINADDQQSDDGNSLTDAEAEAEAEAEAYADEAGLVDGLVDCPIADLELSAYAPILLLV